MAYDYSDDIAFALEMITEYGRDVSLIKLEATAVDPANPFANVVVSPPVSVTVKAVFVYPSGVQNLGKTGVNVGLFTECEQIALVAPDGVNDFTEFHLCDDSDGKKWKLDAKQVLKPGDVNVLYYLGMVAR